MKKRYVFVGLLIMCFVAVFSVPTASGIMVEMNKTGICNYNPSAPIVVHPPFKNLDTFKDSELPSFVCEWAKRWRTAADAPPHEVMRKRLDLHNYFSFHGNYDYSGLFDDGISFTVTVPERDNYKFQITLIEYRHRNGKIFRILKDGEQEITPEEFEKTKLFWAHSFCEAADHHAKQFAALNFRKKIIAASEEELINNKLLEKKGDLEKQIAGKKIKIAGVDFSLEKLMFIPSKSDLDFCSFAPKLAIIIPSRTLYGLAIIESGVILINPESLGEQLIGIGNSIDHELFHRNKYFQGFLWCDTFDVETWTFLSARVNHDWSGFLFHPYQKSIRHAAKIITSFDSQKAREEMFLWKTDAMRAYAINNALFDEYALRANRAAKSLKKEMMEGFPVAFYSNPIYWSCINENFKDRNEATKAYLYSRFAFSLLNGPKETQQWLEENENILLKVYKEVMDKTENESDQKIEEEKNYIEAALKEVDGEALTEVARLLNLRAASKEELIREVKLLIKTGVISIPQIRINPYPLRGFGHAKNAD